MKFSERLREHKHLGMLGLRLVIGVIFILHGIMKWRMLHTAGGVSLPPAMVNLFSFLSIVEPLGGLALILGFLTEWAALGLALIMVGAIYFKINVLHIGFIAQNTTGWEFDLTLLAGNLSLIFSGAGKYSLDRMWKKK